MRVTKEEFDSLAFDGAVLKLEEINRNTDFGEFEKDFIKEYNPKYIYSKLSIEDIEDIHYLEQNGFKFMECQLQIFKRLTSHYDVSIFGDTSIGIEKVESDDDLEKIYEICDNTFDIDRVYIDPLVDNSIARKRYHIYIENSFKNKNQDLYKLVDYKNNKIFGFQTLLYNNDNTVVLLLGSVLPEFQKTGVAYLFDCLLYNNLYDSMRRNIITHVSARNVKIMNFHEKMFGFKVRKNFAVLRKVY